MSRRKSAYKFDVALSFAGPDRSFAERLARACQKIDIAVFYDKDERARLWGQSEKAFEEAYSTASRYVIPIVSEHYPENDWCRHEFAFAKREAKRRSEEFILPVRLDDTPLLGLPDGVIYKTHPRESIRQIVNDLASKLGRNPAAMATNNHRPRNGRHALRMVPPARMRLAGLIAASPLPIDVNWLTALFPAVSWAIEIPRLRRQGLLTEQRSGLTVPKPVRAMLFTDPEDRATLRRQWIDALTPHHSHPDTALFLGLLHLETKNHSAAIAALADGVEFAGTGYYNELLCKMLRSVEEKGMHRKLPARERARFHSGFGLALAQGGDLVTALKQFAISRQITTRTNDVTALGNTHFMTATALYHAGRTDDAAVEYRGAIDCGRKTHDHGLLGRALHNLAMMIVATAPDEAERLFEESGHHKRASGDSTGQVGVLFGRGLVRVYRGDIGESRHWFARAEKLATRVGDLDSRCLSLSNLGTTFVDCGAPREAIAYFRRARQLAEKEGLDDCFGRAVGGEAIAHLRCGDYRETEKLFRDLHALREKQGDVLNAVIALHDVALALLRQKRWATARRMMDRALAQAREHGVEEWIFRCARDGALIEAERGHTDQATELFLRAAASEEKAGRTEVAARLWQALAEYALSIQAPATDIEEAFKRALSSLGKSAPERRVKIFIRRYEWQWDCGEKENALLSLDAAKKAAGEGSLQDQEGRVIDQQGTCLQELGRIREAIPRHRTALTIARETGDMELIGNCLNNLAEAYRRTGRPKKAVLHFKQAEAHARSFGNDELAISVAHNRALALEDLGRSSEAATVLRTCRDSAKRLGLWDEYVRALHGLANHAYRRNKVRQSRDLYRLALKEARRSIVLGETDGGLEHDHEAGALSVLRHGNPSREASIMHDLLRLLAYHGRMQEAGKLFSQLRKLCADHGLLGQSADAHLLLGEYSEHKNEFLDAAKAYIAGMIPASQVSLERMVHVGAQCVGMIIRFPPDERRGRTDDIEHRIRRWITDSMVNGKLNAEVMLWPFRTACRIVDAQDKGKELSDLQIGRLIQEEILRPMKAMEKPSHR